MQGYPWRISDEQQNESYGYCVPIDVFRQLGQSVGFLEINLV